MNAKNRFIDGTLRCVKYQDCLENILSYLQKVSLGQAFLAMEFPQ